MILDVIKISILITVGVVGSFLVFGLLIGYIGGKTNLNLIRTFGRKSIIATNFIGTTVHELSHYIMCIIFLHKVNEVKLCSFKVNDSGVLGEVSHSYNKNSLYQRVGNFFIGIAPIFVGAIVLILSIRLLLPDTFINILEGKTITEFIKTIEYTTVSNYMDTIVNLFRNFIKYIFTLSNLESLSFWIFIIISFSISTHMTLSKADLKNSKDGIFVIFLISLGISIISLYIGGVFNGVMNLLIIFNVFLIMLLCVGVFFNLLAYIISAILSIIFNK